MGRRLANTGSYITYDNRSQLRTTGAATGALRQVEDLGVFMFISGLIEPDDDETAFTGPTGTWILQSPSMDVIDAYIRPELEEMQQDIAGLSSGQAFYGFGSGTYTWTCPPGVTSVSAVCIGGGASSQGATASGNGGGGGGGLGWKNNIPVVPGSTYTVVVGKGGNLQDAVPSGGESYFISAATVRGGPGAYLVGGGFTGDGGGNGGAGIASGGGGGAGGYTGNGGSAVGNSTGGAGSGGGASAGSGYSSTHGYSSGGGTGPFGQGASGFAVSYGGGIGGSGGENGYMGENPWYNYGGNYRHGGLYGGGGGGPGDNTAFGHGIQCGGRGCVRIIWGPGRAFPSTGTGDM